MADETTRLLLEVIGRDRGAKRTLTQLGEAAEDASDEVRHLNETVGVVGKHFDDAGKDAKNLDTEIVRVKKSIVDLAREIDRSPDNLPLFKQLSKEQANLRKLERTKSILTDLLPGEKDGEKSADSVSRGFSGRFIRSAGEAGIKAGAALAAAMPGGIGRGLSSLGPEASAAIAGGLVGVVAAAAPLLGSAVSAAILGGVGAAGLGGGIALAFQDPKIQAAASRLGEHVKGGLVDAADSFKGATLLALDTLGRAFDRMRPQIKRIFEGLAPEVDKIAGGLAGALEAALPGVEKSLGGVSNVLDALADSLPQLGHDIGEFFATISKGSTGAGQAIMALVDIFGFLLDVTAPILVGLSKTFEYTNKIFGFWQKDTGGTKKSLEEMRKAFDEAAAGAERNAKALPAVTSSATAMEHSLEAAKDAAQGAVISLTDLNDVLQTAADKNISAAEATLNYKDALDQAKNAADRKKKVSHDEEQQLLALARRTNALTDAMVKNGASQGEVAARGKTLRDDFIKTARQMGYDQTQAERLADKYLAIPKNVTTKVKADISSALANVRRIQRVINDIHGKTVGIHVSGPGGSGTQISRSAEGGPVFGPGPKGKDSVLKLLAPGEHVLDTGDVDAMGGQAAVSQFRKQLHAGTATVQRFKSGQTWHDAPRFASARPVSVNGAGLGELVLRWLREEIRSRGGQLAVLNLKV